MFTLHMQENQTALHAATKNGSIDIVEYLLEFSIDVLIKDDVSLVYIMNKWCSNNIHISQLELMCFSRTHKDNILDATIKNWHSKLGESSPSVKTQFSELCPSNQWWLTDC